MQILDTEVMEYMVWIVEIQNPDLSFGRHNLDFGRGFYVTTLKKHDWTYDETMDRFYHSKVCKSLSDVRTGMFTFAPRGIIELYEEEVEKSK